jgi:hypothetical protein
VVGEEVHCCGLGERSTRGHFFSKTRVKSRVSFRTGRLFLTTEDGEE